MRKTRNDWIVAGLSLLEKEGIDAVRIDALTGRLGVTKGSFYWHFKTRDEFLQAMIERWELEFSQQPLQDLRSLDEPAAKIESTLAVMRRARRYTAQVRAWAARDKRVARALRRIDAARLRSIAGIFRGAGLPPAVARQRARVLLYYLLGEAVGNNARELTPADRKALTALLLLPPAVRRKPRR